ncbi:MAG TPA: nuclear transport factor 2 family protein [Acidimicrobiales bacterium]|nr:nuclear transport factor 2 family protein [Acidimicrobiales bacterium]
MSAGDDIEAIKQLKARYFRLMDTKDWDGLAGVFADDVHIDMAGEGGGITESVAEYMPFIRQVLADVTTVHHGHMPEITLTSPTTATGIWALEDQLWWPEGSPISSMHGFGHYHEAYEKVEGAWAIKTMTLTRLHRVIATPP